MAWADPWADPCAANSAGAGPAIVERSWPWEGQRDATPPMTVAPRTTASRELRRSEFISWASLLHLSALAYYPTIWNSLEGLPPPDPVSFVPGKEAPSGPKDRCVDVRVASKEKQVEDEGGGEEYGVEREPREHEATDPCKGLHDPHFHLRLEGVLAILVSTHDPCPLQPVQMMRNDARGGYSQSSLYLPHPDRLLLAQHEPIDPEPLSVAEDLRLNLGHPPLLHFCQTSQLPRADNRI